MLNGTKLGMITQGALHIVGSKELREGLNIFKIGAWSY